MANHRVKPTQNAAQLTQNVMPTQIMLNKFDNSAKAFIIIASCVLCIFVGKKLTLDNPRFLFFIAVSLVVIN